jgi:hypothetical protein
MFAWAPAAVARTMASGATKTAILRGLDKRGVPNALPECNSAWTDMLPGVGKWSLVITTRETGVCSQEQDGDSAYLKLSRGRWRVVQEFNEPSCREGAFAAIPLEVQADLLGCP